MGSTGKLFVVAISIWALAAFGFCLGKTPSPMDVPAIQEEYGNPGYPVCDMGNCVWVESKDGKRRTRPTCADKTRFLMTSEDGKKHCIRLEPR